MKNKKTSSLESQPPNPSVEQVYHRLLANGADPLHHDFSIAMAGQSEVVFEGKRLLLAELPHLAHKYEQQCFYVPDTSTVDGITLFEIPRDGRTMLQVASSSGNDVASNVDAYALLGSSAKQLAQIANFIPDPHSFDLHTVMYVRSSHQLLLNPATEMTNATAHRLDELAESIYRQLIPHYDTHNGKQMMNAYLEHQA